MRQQRNGLGQLQALSRQTVQTPWLRWLAPEQTLAADMAHDAYGLSRYTAGNGIQSEWQRSTHPQSHGTLARLVHRRLNPPAASADHSAALSRLSPLLGLGSAHAQTPAPTPPLTSAPTAATADSATSLPGALGLPTEPTALLDWRYLWDPRGNLLLQQGQRLGQREQQAQAYDRQAQLLASVHSQRAPAPNTAQADATDAGHASPWQESAVWRYAYDPQQRRLLAQQGAASQADTQGHTHSSSYSPGTHQPSGTQHNANGQADTQATPQGQRQYQWDALGRLVRLSQDGQPLADYSYDHRGLRTAKRINGHSHYTLYDEARQPQAELNEQGQVQRLYVWLGRQPLAVIDIPAELAHAQPSVGQQASQVLADLGHIVRAWLGQGDAPHTVWLHANHLGAPELATAANGQVIWQARYSPFGQAQTQAQAGFALNLRLPGQVWDAESGLHYNRQRYYDPQAGRYLSPDPLGAPDGPNPYAYVANNPLGHIDPDGLILFAFDGTGNSDKTSDPAMAGSSVSNVVEFRARYDDGNTRYITGVGTVHEDVEYGNIVPDDFAQGKLLDYLTGSDPLYLSDMGGNYSGPARIDRMMLYIRDESESFLNDQVMDIDIVGFSRGAAEARDFANRITQASTQIDGKTYYQYKDENGSTACQWVNFRFMGLWDTVLSTNFSGTGYQLGIPRQFAYVAQAVALNEHRSSNILSYDQRAPLPHSQHWGGFPLESIGPGSSSPGATRIELGFLGSHADIGGGFADNELSKVALAWMIEQAKSAGVKMDEAPMTIAASAVLHDKSNNIQTGQPVETCAVCTGGEDRQVHGAASGSTQRTMGFGADSKSMTYADTHEYITYLDRNSLARYADGPYRGEINTDVTGTVDVRTYVAWLKSHGYSLDNLQVQQ